MVNYSQTPNPYSGGGKQNPFAGGMPNMADLMKGMGGGPGGGKMPDIGSLMGMLGQMGAGGPGGGPGKGPGGMPDPGAMVANMVLRPQRNKYPELPMDAPQKKNYHGKEYNLHSFYVKNKSG